MKKKKLIFFAYSLGIGGIESALIELLKNINYDKYNVTLVLERKEGELLKEVPECVKIIEYSVSNNKNIIFRKIVNFINRLKFSLKHKNKYDFSCSYATYSIPGSTLAKICSKNSCLYVHSSYEYLYGLEEYKTFFNKLNINNFRHIIFVSNEAREFFNKTYSDLEDRTITINNFIDVEKIVKLSEENILLEKGNKTLFVFVARLTEESKKVTRLINLIEYLKNNNKNILCWIVGDGPDRKEYEELIKSKKLEEYIKLIGTKTNPYPYMKQADYLILTSEYEGFPMVYNEAIILNKPIITTMNVTDDYISIPNNFGYIISKNQNELNKEVLDILNNDKLVLKEINLKEINKLKREKIEEIFNCRV